MYIEGKGNFQIKLLSMFKVNAFNMIPARYGFKRSIKSTIPANYLSS